MQNSKLIQILSSFNRQEKEALKKWVQSPMHCQHKKTKALLLLLLSKRKLTERTTNRFQVYQQLYPEQSYQDAQLKHLMRYGVQILEDFIEFLMHKKAAFEAKKSLILFFRERGLENYAQQQQLERDSQYFYQQFQLEQLQFERENSQQRQRATNLQALMEQQHTAFVLETLHYACETILHQRLYKSNYEVPLLESILKDIETGKFEAIPAVRLYYHSYQSLRHPEEEGHFKQVQYLLEQHQSTLSPQLLKTIWRIAINYCVQQLNNGREQYVRAVFDLYQYGLKHGILLEHQQIKQFTYKNIITAAIRLEEYTWTRSFIEQYTPLLAAQHQDNYGRYAQAKLAFAQKDYDQCLQCLVQVEFDDLFLNMSAKVMLLKIYYERQYLDALDALLSSFKRFLQRKAIVAYHREIYKNMIQLTEKLLALVPQDISQQARLRQEILQAHPLTEKPWLLQQLEQL